MGTFNTGTAPSLHETQAEARERMRVASTQPIETQGKPEKKAKRGAFGRIDFPLLTLTLVLLLFGLVMLFSASYPTGYIRHSDSYSFILPQLQYAALGLVVMLGATMVDYHHLKRFAWPLMILTLVLLTVVLFMDPKNGCRRWIWLNGAHTRSFQPSEIVKFAIILLFSAIIAKNQGKMKTFTHGLMPFMLVLGVTSFLLIKEPHLSCTILVLGIGAAMMFAGGTSAKWFVLAGGAAIFLVYMVIEHPDWVPYADDRITMWQDPFGAEGDDAHQIIQSLIAVGSGGITGSGIGASVQKFLYLPEMYNDYIFAILCEELGFVGAIAVMVLFLLLLVRGLHIALRAKDKFGAMLAVGISVQIALQTFLHIAVNTNAIPSTGISLPFFSSGGSSLVMLMGQMGVMLSVSRQGAATVAEARQRRLEEEEAAAEAARPRAQAAQGAQEA